MRLLERKRVMVLGVIGAIFALTLSGAGRASDTVLPGYDLFTTVPPTSFGGVPFVGVPLGTFDFGGGPVGVGTTDTIVRRFDSATAPSTAISTELVALHLMSTVPADFGCGVGTYFITLQSERGGPASPGRMIINFDPEPGPGLPHGTFDSFFDVFFDVRLGGLAGPICLSDTLMLTSTGNPWTHEPPPGALLIDGINHNLNGVDEENDFQPIGVVQEQHPTGAMHSVIITQVPEPGSLALLGAGAVGLIGFARRRRKAA